MERQLGVTEARRQISSLLDQVQYEGEAYIIDRHGEPAAALVPLAVYQRWKEERKRLFDAIRQIQQANPDADPEQVMEDVLEAQQSVRRTS
jgi:prevent-host-death family protein